MTMCQNAHRHCNCDDDADCTATREEMRVRIKALQAAIARAALAQEPVAPTLTDEQIKAALPPMSVFLRESLYDYEQAHVVTYAIQCVRATPPPPAAGGVPDAEHRKRLKAQHDELLERLKIKGGPFDGKPQLHFTRAEVVDLLNAAPAAGGVPPELAAFLNGEAPLEDIWFGERHPTEPGLYWWRKYLRAAIQGDAATTGDQPKGGA